MAKAEDGRTDLGVGNVILTGQQAGPDGRTEADHPSGFVTNSLNFPIQERNLINAQRFLKPNS